VADRWATFDCYGTLIDWNGGIRRELARLFGEERADALLVRYHGVEPEIERSEPSLPYRDVMARALDALGAPADQREALGESLPSWTPFPEVPAALEDARARGWRLAILSNTDRDFIEASKTKLGVPFDETIVASEIGSYKPALGHWRAFERSVGRLPDVHVGASHFHDVVPAGRLGVPTVWINRLGETAEPPPTRELSDLAPLPDVLDELVPA
jgi:2-haloalkanoic acid dehalogenase type II